MNTISIKTCLFNNGQLPCYSTKKAAGADVVLPETVTLKKRGMSAWIDLQIGFDIPEDFCIMLQPRSSTSRKWGVITDTGIIDSDYKNAPIHCCLINYTDKKVAIPAGTRIVQLLVIPVYHVTDWKVSGKVRNPTLGSGSTGD